MKPPCKDCAKREVGCHAKCEEYAKYRAEIDATREAKKAEEQKWTKRRRF